jgi:predicted FMN-binding regulatory protein PaiB
MKKVGFIAVVFAGLFLASCTKAIIVPSNQNEDRTAPTWNYESTEIVGDLNGNNDGGGTITDPNNDPDGTKQKKTNN